MSFAPTANDPHAAYEATLQAQGYEPLPDFCVVDETKFHDRKTGQHVHLDKARLQRMAANQNQRIEGRHAGTPVILGHTEDGKPEGEQPEIVGMATRFHVKPLPDGTSGLWARPWAKPGHTNTFKKNFRRSVELWLDPDAIDPIALLGPTTPRRDLPDHLFARQYGDSEPTTTSSVVRFSRANAYGRQPILFEMRQDMPAVKCDEPGTETPPDAGAAAPDDEMVQKVTNSASFKELASQVQNLTAMFTKIMPIFEELEAEATGGAPGGAPPEAGAAPAGPAGAPPGAGAPPDAAPPEGAGAAPPEPPPDRDDGPVRKNSAGASAGYGNTYMPDANQFAADRELRVRMQRLETDSIQSKRENEALKRQLAETEQRSKVLQFARTSDQVNADLDALERDGIKVVREVDHAHLCALAEKDRAKAIQFMRDTRAKTEPALPGQGGPLVNPAHVQLQPFKFERMDLPPMPGDAAMGSGPAVAGPADFARLAMEAKAAGMDPLAYFDAKRAAPATANGVAVR